jgi:DNA-binding transcriptional LysR family regulator
MADQRVLVSRKVWRTDSHLATLRLVQAGLGWAYLPRRLAAPMLESGELLGIGFAHMSNQVRLWVDVVWLNDRAAGAWRPAPDRADEGYRRAGGAARGGISGTVLFCCLYLTRGRPCVC